MRLLFLPQEALYSSMWITSTAATSLHMGLALPME